MKMYELTGHWYIKKNWFGFNVFVEVEGQSTCKHTGDLDPVTQYWRKSTPSDLIKLNIHII
jgi:hypothetical protein